MYFQVINGADRGKVFIAEQVIDEDDIAISQEGKQYLLTDLRELNQEEIDKCFKKESIF